MALSSVNSCISQSPFCPSLPPPRRPALWRRRLKNKMVPSARICSKNPNDCDFTGRRPCLLLGVSVLPLLQSRAGAVEGSARDEQDKASLEQPHEQEAPVKLFLNFLNGIGIIGLGVLRALYALSKNEIATLESTIEPMRNKLNEKAMALDALENNSRRSLQQEQEIKIQQIRKIEEEQASLSSILASANNALIKVQSELHNEKELVQDLKTQMDHLQSAIDQVGEDQMMFKAKMKKKEDAAEMLQERLDLLTSVIEDKEMKTESLRRSLFVKQLECEKSVSIFNQTKEELAQVNALVEELKMEILRREKECVEFKLFSDNRAVSDFKILANKEFELTQLKQKLAMVLNEARSHRESIIEISQERDTLRTLLEEEKGTVKELQHELQNAPETLEATIFEAAELSEQLKHLKSSCEEHRSEVSRIQTQYSEALASLNHDMDVLKSSGKVVSDQLVSVKEALSKERGELLFVIEKLRDVSEAQENLAKELSETCKEAETAESNLKGERKVFASLNEELEELRKQILVDEVIRNYLRKKDLEAAAQFLDETNKQVLSLSREQEISGTNRADLDIEREMLYKSLLEQNGAMGEAQENLEDAKNLLSELDKQRENLETKSKSLDEDLACI